MRNIEAALLKLEKLQRLEDEARRAAINTSVKDHIAPVYYELFEDIKRCEHSEYNLPGGRGSCKSSFVSLAIVDGVMGDMSGQANAIVFRYVAETLQDSAYAQILWAIDKLNVSHLWECTTKPMKCKYVPTGAEILFKGLDKPTKLKSIRPKHGYFKYVWFEEFCELPGEGFVRSVMQSVIRGSTNGTFVFRTFNPPISQNNWANQLINQPNERAITLLTNYTQVPAEWLGDAFIFEAERLRQINPRAYEHEYLGAATGSGNEVFPNLEIKGITDAEIEEMVHVYQGLDWGFAVDPACFVRVHYDKKHETVYLLDEIYERQKSNAWMAGAIKERGYGDWNITADSAEPKSIADMRDLGLRCRGCTKYPGVVEYRVKWLQHRKIVVDPQRTPNAYREFVNYSYPVDKNGEFLSVLPDRDNHTIDAVAYALDSVIGKRGNSA